MISAVVPVFNEEESIDAFYVRLSKALLKLDKECEIIFVDDGSTDKSLSLLQELSKKDKHIKIYSFRRNQGKAEALTYGFQKAQGDYIVTLDADLQDQPEEIEDLLKKANEGYDVVSGWRKERKDAGNMKIISKLFNWIMGMLWGVDLHDYNCGLKLYTKEAAKCLRLYGGMHRFIPLLAYEQGFRVTEIPVVHESRKFGKSKYGFSKVWKDLPDMFTVIFLTRYGKRPSHFFGVVGSVLLFIGLIFLSYLTYLHFFLHQSVGDRPLWSIGILFVLVGLQIGFTGFLADLVTNVSQNNKMHDLSSYPIKYTSDRA
ncbi:MAG: glycosyltransferase family 2 protein [Patescibacteria group bacterium]|nr:glycosyltransferase family 2 protein [Patescibacteria group bacterium]